MSDLGTNSKNPFLLALARTRGVRRPLILDGATGTELDNRGADTHSSLWSGMAALAEPELLRAVHRDYVEAGAEVITANTFRTTRLAFHRAGVDGELWIEATIAAVRIAQEAASDRAVVAGSVAPLEDCFTPNAAPSYDDALKEHAPFCKTLVSAGVDVLWLETFGTVEELTAAIDAARQAGGEHVPFAVSVTTTANGTLLSGESLYEAAVLATDKGAAAFSINCIPTSHVQMAMEILPGATTLPLGVYANLGVPEANQDWKGSAYLAPEKYAELSRSWPISMVGGCCGSTPEHIAALRQFYVGD